MSSKELSLCLFHVSRIFWRSGHPSSHIRNVVRSRKRTNNSDPSTSSSIHIPPAKAFLPVRRRMSPFLAHLRGNSMSCVIGLVTLSSCYGTTQADPPSGHAPCPDAEAGRIQNMHRQSRIAGQGIDLEKTAGTFESEIELDLEYNPRCRCVDVFEEWL